MTSKKSISNTLGIVAGVLVLLSCEKSFSGTDLGVIGNNYVRDRFESYKVKNPVGQCDRQHPELPSALVTGFGLFHWVSYNISGVVVQFSSGFFKDSTQVTTRPLLEASDLGAHAATQVLKLEQREVEVCFLNLEVSWDLAASLILFEAQNFNPNAILMTGRGLGTTAVFENQANNIVVPGAGYNFKGELLVDENTPQSTWILGSQAAPPTIVFNWERKRIVKAVKSELIGTKYKVKYSSSVNSAGTFLCNNVGYVVGAALQGYEISLAGGEIIFAAGALKQQATFGFLHLPSVDIYEPTIEPSTLEGLSRLVLKSLSLMLDKK